jgi:hypothetical protein
MRVAIIQSNYIPWRGYFDFIDDVDLFIFYDDVQFTRRDWRNRNKIKTSHGLAWLTVPIQKNEKLFIMDTVIDYSKDWQKTHFGSLYYNYHKAPFWDDYFNEFRTILLRNFSSISELNIHLCHWCMEILNIATPTRRSQELKSTGSKTARLIDILTKVGADTYLSGPAAAGYLDLELFRRHGIRLEYKSYDYPPYPQLWGGFAGEVAILDLLFNTGPKARRYLKSQTPNQQVVG